MPRKHPRSGLSGSSFDSHLIYLDRQANKYTNWISYQQLMPPEAERYGQDIQKIKRVLSQHKYRTPIHRRQLEMLIHRYRTDLAVLAKDFWETHSLYS